MEEHGGGTVEAAEQTAPEPWLAPEPALLFILQFQLPISCALKEEHVERLHVAQLRSVCAQLRQDHHSFPDQLQVCAAAPTLPIVPAQ